MSDATAIAPIGGLSFGEAEVNPPVAARPRVGASFASLLVDGVDKVEAKLQAAEAATQAFALDDSVPLHQVTFALEEARLAVELAMQVRARLVEGYQELLRMQL